MREHREHPEAKYQEELDRLPKQVVDKAGFRTLATKAGWTAEIIDKVLTGNLPSRFVKVGEDAVLVADVEEIEFKNAYEDLLVKQP